MEDVYIIKCGANTPIGSRAGTTAGGIRIGYSNIKAVPDFEDSSWENIKMGVVEDIDEDLEIIPRLMQLIQPALMEALQPFNNIDLKGERIPIFIGLPKTRPGIPEDLTESLPWGFLDIEQKIQKRFDFRFIPQGHTSGLLAMESAMEKISTGQMSFCLIGGVDSYYNQETLFWLEDTGRLFCTENKNGFIPGEGAGFCLLASNSAIEEYNITSLAKVLGIGSAEEKRTFDSGKMSSAEGVKSATDKVLKDLPEGEKLSKIYCNLNGENYYTNEMTCLSMHLGNLLNKPGDFMSPVSFCGDLGAATVPVLICLATEAGRKGYAEGPYNLLLTSSLESQRATVLLKLNINEEMRKLWEK